jgi:gluconate 2-dehydrogenase gamma chain
MPSRRDALHVIAAVAGSIPVAAQHNHSAAPAKAPSLPQARTFSEPELKTLAALTETMIPRTETPGAADVGVPLLIDELVTLNPARKDEWIALLRDFDERSNKKYKRAYVELSGSERESVMKGAMDDDAASFTLLKGTTIELYYRTREGLEGELGWHGNTYLPEFKGCTHPEHQIARKA